jgi:hypothetical protein
MHLGGHMQPAGRVFETPGLGDVQLTMIIGKLTLANLSVGKNHNNLSFK